MSEFTAAVRYQGFVYTDTNDVAKLPGLEHVNLAVKMLSKKNLKKTRDVHPLFGRGFDAQLLLDVSASGLVVKLDQTVVMNHSMHKIAFVASVSKTLGILMKRPGIGKFKCHLFTCASDAAASDTCANLAKLANEVFAKLRRVKELLEKKNKMPPALPERKAQLPDEQQPWFHGKITRQEAERRLMTANVTNGLFLVRQSESSPRDYALSFCYGTKVYHNKIKRNTKGMVVSTGGTEFESLTRMVNHYQSPQSDMQTIITEYVPNEPADGDGAAAVYMNVALLHAPVQEVEASWDTSDILAALEEIETGQSRVSAVEDHNAIDFDPIYDDIAFGFGNDFVATTLKRDDAVEPLPENDLENLEVFDLGELEGEAEC